MAGHIHNMNPDTVVTIETLSTLNVPYLFVWLYVYVLQDTTQYYLQDDKNNNEFVATSQQFQDNEIMSKY